MSTPLDNDQLLAGFIAGDNEAMGALNQKMGVKILEASADRVVATMPVEGNTQPYGLLHGGASVVLAESLAPWDPRSMLTPTASRSGSTSTPPTIAPPRAASSPASQRRFTSVGAWPATRS